MYRCEVKSSQTNKLACDKVQLLGKRHNSERYYFGVMPLVNIKLHEVLLFYIDYVKNSEVSYSQKFAVLPGSICSLRQIPTAKPLALISCGIFSRYPAFSFVANQNTLSIQHLLKR
jgi:hypothetical protein